MVYKLYRKTCYLLLFSYFLYCHAASSIVFSSQQSSVKLNHGSSLSLSSTMGNWSGRLVQEGSASVSGGDIDFTSGTWVKDGVESTVSGTYSSLSGEIKLTGNECFCVNAGFVELPIIVSGSGNRIEGQPLLRESITLIDSSSELTSAIHTAFPTNIFLNGGSLTLEHDFDLTKNGRIIGPGALRGENAFVHISDVRQTWSENLDFYNSIGVLFSGKTNLTGEWHFYGDHIVRGNGSELDLSGGGSIVIEDGATVHFVDTIISGVGSDSIRMASAGATLKISRTNLDFVHNASFVQGNVVIEAPSTFTLHDNVLSIVGSAKITLDNAELTLDVYDGVEKTPIGSLNIMNEQGQLRPLFTNHKKNQEFITEALKAGRLLFLGKGDVQESGGVIATDVVTTSSVVVINSSDASLTNSSAIVNVNTAGGGQTGINQSDAFLFQKKGLKGSYILENTHFIKKGQVIRIRGNTRINGNGNSLFFSGGDLPQLVIEPNVTLFLENITFARLTFNSIKFIKKQLSVPSVMEIGQGVQFDLFDDMNLQDGKIKILGTPDRPNVMTFLGLGKAQKIRLSPVKKFSDPIALDIGVNMVKMENIELEGSNYIAFKEEERKDGLRITGALGLFGNTRVQIDNNASLCFYIRGLSNKFVLEKASITLEGQVLFDSFVDCELRIASNSIDGSFRNAHLNIKDNVFFIDSRGGRAVLHFQDDNITVNNLGENSIVFGNNAFLIGHTVNIEGFPIKQLGRYFNAGTGVRLQGKNNSSIKRATGGARCFPNKIVTAVSVSKRSKRKLSYKKKFMKKSASRDNLKNQLLVEGAISLSDAEGIIAIDGGIVNHFAIGERPCDLTIRDGGTLNVKNEKVILKETDVIRVRGAGNTITIQDEFILKGSLDFEEGSELTINFVKKSHNPIMNLSLVDQALCLPKGVRFSATGRGSIIPCDGFSINLKGDSDFKLRPVFDLSRMAMLELRDGRRVSIQGKGRIALDGGRLWVGDGSHLIICENIHDDIDVRVMNNGIIAITPFVFEQGLELAYSSEIKKHSYLSLHKGSFSVTLSDKSFLYLGRQGHFEFNALKGAPSPGFLKYFFMLRDGICHFHPEAIFTVGPNRGDGQLLKERPWNQVVAGGTIQGIGSVELAGTNLRGVVNDVGSIDLQDFTAGKLVKGMLQKARGKLSHAVLFEEIETGKKRLMLKPAKKKVVGTIVELNDDDEIVSEDSETGVVFLQRQGNPVTITPDGIRSGG